MVKTKPFIWLLSVALVEVISTVLTTPEQHYPRAHLLTQMAFSSQISSTDRLSTMLISVRLDADVSQDFILLPFQQLDLTETLTTLTATITVTPTTSQESIAQSLISWKQTNTPGELPHTLALEVVHTTTIATEVANKLLISSKRVFSDPVRRSTLEHHSMWRSNLETQATSSLWLKEATLMNLMSTMDTSVAWHTLSQETVPSLWAAGDLMMVSLGFNMVPVEAHAIRATISTSAT